MLLSKNGNHIDDVERLDLIEGEGVTLTLTARTQNDEMAVTISALSAELVGVSLTPTTAARNTIQPSVANITPLTLRNPVGTSDYILKLQTSGGTDRVDFLVDTNR